MEIFGWLAGGLALWAFSSNVALGGLLAGALVFGSLGFWILLGFAATFMFVFIDHDDGVGATGTLVMFFLIHQLYGSFKVFSYIRFNPVQTAGYIAAYFLAGTAWSIAKWWFHVREERNKYDEARDKFLIKKGYKAGAMMQEGLKKDWAYEAPEKPSASESKDKILRWMSFWPWSMVWTLINDPIKKAFRAIYRGLQKSLQAIADRAFAGTEADFHKGERA